MTTSVSTHIGIRSLDRRIVIFFYNADIIFCVMYMYIASSFYIKNGSQIPTSYAVSKECDMFYISQLSNLQYVSFILPEPK